MKKEIVIPPTSIKVNGNLLSRVKEHCLKTGTKIGFFYDKAVEEKLERELLKSTNHE